MQLTSTIKYNHWPDKIPDLPFDGQGWCMQHSLDLFDKYLNPQTAVVVELGAWLGLSTRHILSRAKNAQVFTIDTWKGSAEHREMPEIKDRLPILFDQFCRNCWEFRDRLHIIEGTTRDALFFLLTELEVRPNFFYVDASHATKDVYDDIAQCRLFGDAVIVGDDWTWETVRTGVELYCSDHYIEHKLGFNDICWWIEP